MRFGTSTNGVDPTIEDKGNIVAVYSGGRETVLAAGDDARGAYVSYTRGGSDPLAPAGEAVISHTSGGNETVVVVNPK